MKEIFKTPKKGKIIYNPDEDSYQFSTPQLDFGIMSEGFWEDFEGKEVEITIRCK